MMDINKRNKILKYIDKHAYKKALKHLEEILKDKDYNADIYNLMAKCYVGEHRVEEAWECLRNALSLEPENIYTKTSYLKLLVLMGQPKKALALIEELKSMAPTNKEVIESRICLYELTENEEEFKSLLNSIKDSAIDNKEEYLNRVEDIKKRSVRTPIITVVSVTAVLLLLINI